MKVLVVGRGGGVREELAAVRAMSSFDATVVINKIGVDFPEPFQHWVSFHASLLYSWADRRASRGVAITCDFWTSTYWGRSPYRTIHGRPLGCISVSGGSSGLIAAVLALDVLQARRIVLTGIPMEASAGHDGDPRPWREANKHWAAWERHLERMQGRVKSMSGRTRDHLGVPTREWLSSC